MLHYRQCFGSGFFADPDFKNPHSVPSINKTSVAEPPLFWATPAPDDQGPGADYGSDLLGSAPAPGKKRRLQAAPYTKIFHFKLSKS